VLSEGRSEYCSSGAIGRGEKRGGEHQRESLARILNVPEKVKGNGETEEGQEESEEGKEEYIVNTGLRTEGS